MPILLWSFQTLLELERLACGTEVDGIAAILLFIKNTCNCCHTPIIRDGGQLTAFSPDTVPILCRRKHFSERSRLAICVSLKPEHTSQRFVIPPLRQALQQSIRLCFWDFSYTQKADLVVSGLPDIPLLCITLRTLSLPIADLLPKRKNAQNLTLLYGFEAILGVFFRYERLCFDSSKLYRQPFKSRCLSLLGNKKAPYYYNAFISLGRWSKETLFNYLLYFFFLLTTVVPMAAPPLTSSRTNHKARLLLSPVFGESVGFAVPFVPLPALPLFLLH